MTRFSIAQTGEGAIAVDTQSRDFTITPTAAHVVYKGVSRNGLGALRASRWIRLEPTPLHGCRAPRGRRSLKPDGQWIGFVETAPITLKKIAITGGPALTITPLDGASRGAVWMGDDTIIFATALTATGLQRVPADGGTPTVLTTPDPARGEDDHLWPQIVARQERACSSRLRCTTGGMDASQIAVLDLGDTTRAPKILLRGGSQAQYVPTGHLVYAAPARCAPSRSTSTAWKRPAHRFPCSRRS